MEQKGLDMVRRDWSPLSKDCGGQALRAILSGAARDEVVDSIHEHLADVKEKVGGWQSACLFAASTACLGFGVGSARGLQASQLWGRDAEAGLQAL
jgi:hypothetical protein